MTREEVKAAMLEVLQAEETKRVLAEALKATIDAEERKRVIHDAINEWLEKKYSDVGRWTMRGIAAAAVATLLYITLWERGWRPPH